MNRLLMLGATAIAGALIATPTLIGLSGNTSFSRDLQVPVPPGAHDVQLSDLTPSVAHSAPSASEDRTSGPGAEHGRIEDRPGHDVASSAATDDHGGLRTANSSGPGGGSSGGDDHRGGDDRDPGRSRGGDG